MNEIDDVIKMLDNMAEGGVSRIKVETSADISDGEVKKAYHHGRCDVGSPFASGKLFDLSISNPGACSISLPTSESGHTLIKRTPNSKICPCNLSGDFV